MHDSSDRLSHRRRRRGTSGFTLVELLVVIALILVMATVVTVVARNVVRKGRQAACAARLKSLGLATLLYSQDNQDQLPRSFHSAGAHGEPGWAVSIAPYLGVSGPQIETDWPTVFNKHYRSPVDPSTDPYVYSYALNVHFELDPDGDDYKGSPATWHRLSQIPSPGATILMGQPKPTRFGDHLMCHQWSNVKAAKNALNHQIHDGKANYLFLDCHVDAMRVEDTFDPSRKINRWNPSLTR